MTAVHGRRRTTVLANWWWSHCLRRKADRRLAREEDSVCARRPPRARIASASCPASARSKALAADRAAIDVADNTGVACGRGGLDWAACGSWPGRSGRSRPEAVAILQVHELAPIELRVLQDGCLLTPFGMIVPELLAYVRQFEPGVHRSPSSRCAHTYPSPR